MKTQVVYPAAQANVFANIRSTVLNSKFMISFAALISLMLEEEVSVSKSLHLLHANIAFACVILFAGVSVWMAFVLLAWFALTIVQCKRAFAQRN